MIKPLYVKSTEISPTAIVAVFGKTNGIDWSVPCLKNPHAQSLGSFQTQFKRIQEAITTTFGNNYQQRIFMPKLGHGDTMTSARYGQYFNTVLTNHSSAKIYRSSLYVDAVTIPFGTVVGIRSGDCHTLILCSGNKVCAGHISRNTLLNPRGIEEGVVVTILDKMLAYFRDCTPGSMSAFIACGISGEHFIHPLGDKRYGTYNKKMFRVLKETYGYPSVLSKRGVLDIPEIIRLHLIKKKRMRPEDIKTDGLDTFSNPLCHSHKTGDRGRNLVLVANK